MCRDILKVSVNEIVPNDQECFPPFFAVKNVGRGRAEKPLISPSSQEVRSMK